MKNYHIKAYPDQIKAWKHAAQTEGIPINVSDWARACLWAATMGIKVEYTDPKMVRGNNTERDELAEDFQFRVCDDYPEKFTAEAERQCLGVGEWCRQVLDFYARM